MLKVLKRITASKVPSDTFWLIHDEDTRNKKLTKSYEQEFLSLNSDDILEMERVLKKWDPSIYSESGDVREGEREKGEALKEIDKWIKLKQEQESLITKINSASNLKDFNHQDFVKLIKQYLKDWDK